MFTADPKEYSASVLKIEHFPENGGSSFLNHP
jgi:hypothetical protein